MSPALFGVALAAAVGAGVNGGVFFAFSSFVMPALRRLPDADGIAAMQSVNVTAVRPAFMSVLFGTAALCLVLIVARDAAAPWLIGGGALFLLGVVGVTVAANVPINDAVAALDPHAPAAARAWADHAHDWTLWNHVRTVAGAAAAAAFTVALTV
jgi:uncharacterized membrane protein